jgi:hypothetical protein
LPPGIVPDHLSFPLGLTKKSAFGAACSVAARAKRVRRGFMMREL